MVLEHTDYRIYLKTVLAERTAKNPKYSLRAMARSFAISPTLLSQINNGKRNLSALTAVRLAKKLGLSRREADYFCSLVQYQDAKNVSAKELLLEKVNALRSVRKVHNLECDSFKALSDWYHFAIIELVRQKGFKASPLAIAKRLNISSIDAEVALQRLVRLEILAPLESGGYAVTKAAIRVESREKNQALQIFHRQMLQKAIESLPAQNPSERHFGSETISIDVSQIPEAQKKINDFLDEMASFFSEAQNPTETYHLGVQLFRLTNRETK